MNTAIPFRRRALATCVAATCSGLPLAGNAAANAGKIDFAIGNVTATTASGDQRELRKGAQISVGDTIETNKGRAWLRFRDGGYMSLLPGTEFRVDDYHFEGEEDGNEKSFFSLLRGGMRAVTGLVGKTNRNNYRVNTPIATIGIRGTEYLAQLGNSLTVSCGAGVCIVTNDAGETVLEAGQTVYVKDNQSKSERTTRKVVLPPNAPVVFSGSEFRNDDGSLEIIQLVDDVVPETPDNLFSEDVPLVEGENVGVFAAFTYSGDGGEAGLLAGTELVKGSPPNYVTATLDGDLALLNATWNDGTERVNFDHDNPAGSPSTLQEFDTDGVIAWGRWGESDVVDGTIFGAEDEALDVSDEQNSVHYLVGVPTPETDLANLKALDTVAVYNLIGATMPTFGNDSFEGGGDFGNIIKVSGALAANFGRSTVETSLVLDYTNNDVSINSGPLPISPGRGGSFGGSGAFATSTLNLSANYNTQIRGFFAGGGASRAGYAYDVFIDTSSPNYTIHGVAAFQKGGSASSVTFAPPAPE